MHKIFVLWAFLPYNWVGDIVTAPIAQNVNFVGFTPYNWRILTACTIERVRRLRDIVRAAARIVNHCFEMLFVALF